MRRRALGRFTAGIAGATFWVAALANVTRATCFAAIALAVILLPSVVAEVRVVVVVLPPRA